MRLLGMTEEAQAAVAAFHDVAPPADLGPHMTALSDRERRFVWAYLLNGGNGAEAARMAGYSDRAEGAKVRACMLMQREKVIAAMNEVAWRDMRGAALLAALRLKQMLDKPDHPDHTKAIGMVLSRVGYSEKTAHEVLHKVEGPADRDMAAVEDLRMLKRLGVPREKLIEMYGFSGLGRYEAMLAAADAKALPAPVDAEFTEVADDAKSQ